jgi:hypothetical protein
MARTLGLGWFWMTSACLLRNLVVIIYIRNVERQMQIANRCAPVKIANSAENSILQALFPIVVAKQQP